MDKEDAVKLAEANMENTLQADFTKIGKELPIS